MKRVFSLCILVSLGAALFAESLSDGSVFGSVSVANNGELPSGYFSKAENYLPGDNIAVTNPDSGVTINVLNLGAFESADAVLLLTPEAAKKLGVGSDGSIRVKLSPRPDNFDDIASGTAILSSGGKEEVADVKTKEAPRKAKAEPAPAAVAEPEEDEYVDEDAHFPSDLFADDDSIEVASVDVPDYGTVKVQAVPAEEAPVQKKKASARQPKNAVVQESLAASEPDVASAKEAPQKVEETIPQEEELEAILDEDLINEIFASSDEAVAKSVTREPEVEVVGQESEDSDIEYVDEEIEVEVEEEVPVEQPPVIEESLLLIPTAPVLPPKPEKEEEPRQLKSKAGAKDVVEEEVVAPKASSAKSVVKSEAELKKGSFYIQIAMTADKAQADKIVQKYSKYPVVLVPLANSKGYKVLVGALTADEYGAVLARFKAYGYKDAFVRKIK